MCVGKCVNLHYVFSGYGSVLDVETSGASAVTARQDRLSAGVEASHTMAKTDLQRMERYKAIIKEVGRKYGVEPALIAAIISRESRAGNCLSGGYGDGGNAFGLMQVDINPRGGGHTARGEWNSKEHIEQGTEILVHFIKTISAKFPWSQEQKLKGGIAAYNAGDQRVTSTNVDEYTTGGDYSNDVIARAQWYKRNGY
ncbi:lysozyme g-like isoform X1 [Cynoglossus semilaevis]|nr:lysozyme g-like isoform X1 [Cynoglossus semilaevis]